jgi:predicted ABC-type transport system involved in lysophospholipase L1 biosynthesis ATPase subunit
MTQIEPYREGEQDVHGITATVVNVENGRTMTLAEERGAALEALTAIAAFLDTLDDGDWRIRTLSTPRTILSDLRASRSGAPRWSTPPERRFLSQIGRLDLLETA